MVILIILVNLAGFVLIGVKARRYFGQKDLVFWAIFLGFFAILLGAAAVVFPAELELQAPAGEWPLYVGLVVALLAVLSIWRSNWHLVAATVLYIAMGMALVPSRTEAAAAGFSGLALVWYFSSRARGNDPFRPARGAD